jgi:tRNA(Arg) A34 adenosine deaminase TadA
MTDDGSTLDRFMREAIALAIENARTGRGGPFGAIVVCDGEVVGRGTNQVTSATDPTAHAEIVAIRAACARLGTFRLDRCEIFSSCEPCPMCLGAIYWARIGRLHFAATHLDAAEAGFDDATFYREIGLPIQRRRLPTAQRLRDEALVAFAEWRSRPDGIPY